MGLKPGYKQTEAGVIPEDWDTKKLRDSCTKITDGTHDTPKQVASGVPFLTAIHVKDNWINFESCLFVTQAIHEAIYKRCNPERDDVLMVNIGAGVATSALVNVDFEFSLKNVALLKPNKQLLIGSFLNYSLAKAKPSITQSLSSGGAQPFLSLSQIGELVIPLPPTKLEQEAIAEALSDADALIEGLEQIIAKKRHLKQGAMQELLRSREGWVTKRLDELGEICSGGTPSTNQPQFWDGQIPWCTPTDITALNGHKYIYDTSRRITALGLKSSSAEMIPPNSIVMTSRATIGECAINKVAVSTNQGFKNLVLFEDVDVEFLYYLLLTKKQDLISLSSGSTFLEIGKMQLTNFEIRLPNAKSEQITISAVLSDMDAEIDALEEKLTKARQIKQGMMQELLTGRVRLI